MKKIMILSCILMMYLFTTAQSKYYVDPSASGSNSGTLANPWKTLNKVEDAALLATFGPGDTIFFKRGQTFTPRDQFNGFRWWHWAGYVAPSGTRTAPIVLTNYGNPTDPMPNFWFVNPASTDSTNKNILSFEGVSWIVLDGLQFNDTRFAPHNNKVDAAYSLGVVFGESGGGAETSHCVMRNCYFSDCGMGVIIVGDSNIVENTTMVRFGNDYANDGSGGDYGANAITVTGNDNIFRYNYFQEAWAWSGDFGTNGGAFEVYNNIKRMRIYGNKIVDCGGICEMGASVSSRKIDSVFIYSNLLINNGANCYINMGVSNPFAVQPSHIMYENNTIIENDSSRWSGDNYNHGMEHFPNYVGKEAYHFSRANGSVDSSIIYELRNNLIFDECDMDLISSNVSTYTVHKNNVAKWGSAATGSSNWGYTKDATEVLYTGAISNIWVDVSDDSVVNWNLHLKTGSPAIGVGTTRSEVTEDYDRQPPPSPFDAGALWYVNPVGCDGCIITRTPFK